MKILLAQTGFIGDVILSSPVIQALRELYPDAEIDLLTTPLAAPLFAAHAELKKVIVFDKRASRKGFRGLLKMAADLRREQYAAVFSLHKSARSALLYWLAGIPQRYGFREAALPWLYSDTARRSDLPHDVLRNLAILRNLGREPESFTGELSIVLSDEARASAAELLGRVSDSQRLVAIAPGSVWATKRWHVEGFIEVVRILLAQNFTVVLLGGPEDQALGEQIQQAHSGTDEIVNLIGRTSLPVSAAVIARAALLLSNDSAPLHLGSAVKTPVVAIFCATVPEFGFGPWRVEHAVVGVSGLSCRPCGRHGGNTCPTGTLACQRQLAPQSVVDSILRILAVQLPGAVRG